jgi:hypothetical protein
MRFYAAALCGLVLAGCSDDPPTIRMIQYSPNAALVGVMSTINGQVSFTDPDGDISQSQVTLTDPTGASVTSSMTPITDVNQGPIGMVPFSIDFTPGIAGNWTFNFWIIDLQGRSSNVLMNNVIRVSNP